MFDGKVNTTQSYRRTAPPRGGGRKVHQLSQAQLLEQSRKLREDRAAEKVRRNAAVLLQATVRMFLCRQREFTHMRHLFSEKAANVMKMKALFERQGSNFKVPTTVLLELLRYFFAFSSMKGSSFADDIDDERLLVLLQLCYESSGCADEKNNLWLTAGAAVAESTADASTWLLLMRKLHGLCVVQSTRSILASSSQTRRGISALSKQTLLHLTADVSGAAEHLRRGLVLSLAPQLCASLSKLIENPEVDYATGDDAAMDIESEPEGKTPTLVSTHEVASAFALILMNALRSVSNDEALSIHLPIATHLLSIKNIRDHTELHPLLNSLLIHWQSAHVAVGVEVCKAANFSELKLLRALANMLILSPASSTSPQWIQMFVECVREVGNSLPLASLLHGTHFGYQPDGQVAGSIHGEELLQDFILAHGNTGPSGDTLNIDVTTAIDLKLAILLDQSRRAGSSASESYHPDASTRGSFAIVLQAVTDPTFLVNLVNSHVLSPESGTYEGLHALAAFAQILVTCPSASLSVLKNRHVAIVQSNSGGTSTLGHVEASILNTIAFSGRSTPFPRRIWRYLVGTFSWDKLKQVLTDDQWGQDVGNVGELQYDLTLCLYLFFSSLSHQLLTTDDEEYFEQGKVLDIEESLLVIQLLKATLYRFFRAPPRMIGQENAENLDCSGRMCCMQVLQLRLHQVSLRLYNQFYFLNERRPFVGPPVPELTGHTATDSAAAAAHANSVAAVWQWSSLVSKDFELVPFIDSTHSKITSILGVGSSFSRMDSNPDEISDARNASTSLIDSRWAYTWVELGGPLTNKRLWSALLSCPQVAPFQERVRVFQALLDADKDTLSGSRFLNEFGYGPTTRVQIHRDNLFYTAFQQLKGIPEPALKGRFQIEFFQAEGLAEAGIDGGGLFKEFVDSFVRQSFDSEFHLFSPTSSNLLVPNSSAAEYYPEEHLEYFKFAGKILGKAMYDCVLVDSQFSVIFLNVLLGKINSFDDLRFLDEQTYRSLRQLKQMAASGEDISLLDLYFAVERNDVDGNAITEDLIVNGRNIPVTNNNYIKYMHCFANHKLNTQISQQCRAFLSGFRQLISVEWMRLFSPRELQVLISGEERGLDVNDWQRNVNYASGYAAGQPYIQKFWDIVASFDVEQQRNLLKFITSCSRQPLRGFSQLQPLICIQKVPCFSQDQFESETGVLTSRLPGAATCMNLLKLPEYDSAEMLREKLLYAITNNNMGFELS